MASHKKWEKQEEISSKQNKNNVKTHKYLVALFTNRVFTITLNFLKFLDTVYLRRNITEKVSSQNLERVESFESDFALLEKLFSFSPIKH